MAYLIILIASGSLIFEGLPPTVGIRIAPKPKAETFQSKLPKSRYFTAHHQPQINTQTTYRRYPNNPLPPLSQATDVRQVHHQFAEKESFNSKSLPFRAIQEFQSTPPAQELSNPNRSSHSFTIGERER